VVDLSEQASLLFREARMSDIPALREIRSAVTENALSDPEQITAKMIEDYLTILGKGWVCECDGRVLGFSFAASKSQSIWALFVRPGQEGQGIGKRLLALASDWLFAQGAVRVVLGTAPNTRADRFYLAQGWSRGGLLENGEIFYSLDRKD
jgi:GNAT superfamily N-acetyltransferase